MFSSTLYIGAHTHGLYALPAYATSPTDLLLNGPSSEDAAAITNQESTALLGKQFIFTLPNVIISVSVLFD